MGNFKDSKLQTLAKKGNGNYAYLDDYGEAEKVLVKELSQTFYEVADDVFMNVRFNPSMVKQYRLVGFDNRKDAVTDSASDMQGGQIGSGNSTLAVFEIIPTQQNLLTRFTSLGEDVATLFLRYRNHNDTAQLHSIFKVRNNFIPIDTADRELRFVTAVTMFALKLKQSPYLKSSVDWPFIRSFAITAADKNNFLQREFLKLIDNAESIYDPKNKRKKKRLFF
jgi:Ca-activated chloride channel family protein